MTSAPFPSRQVFVDTSAHYGLVDPADTVHADALRVARRLAEERWRTYTSNFIVAETHALTLSHLGRAAALQVIQELVDGEMRVIRVRPADERRARAILQQYGDKDFSYTDATSFAIMERLGIGTAFTFDEDFHQYGFIDLAQQL